MATTFRYTFPTQKAVGDMWRTKTHLFEATATDAEKVTERAQAIAQLMALLPTADATGKPIKICAAITDIITISPVPRNAADAAAFLNEAPAPSETDLQRCATVAASLHGSILRLLEPDEVTVNQQPSNHNVLGLEATFNGSNIVLTNAGSRNPTIVSLLAHFEAIRTRWTGTCLCLPANGVKQLDKDAGDFVFDMLHTRFALEYTPRQVQRNVKQMRAALLSDSNTFSVFHQEYTRTCNEAFKTGLPDSRNPSSVGFITTALVIATLSVMFWMTHEQNLGDINPLTAIEMLLDGMLKPDQKDTQVTMEWMNKLQPRGEILRLFTMPDDALPAKVQRTESVATTPYQVSQPQPQYQSQPPQQQQFPHILQGIPKVAEMSMTRQSPAPSQPNPYNGLQIVPTVQIERAPPTPSVGQVRARRYCTHCKINGHEDSECFKLHPELHAAWKEKLEQKKSQRHSTRR